MKKLLLSIFVVSVLFGTTGCLAPSVELKDALLTKLTQKDLEVGLDFDISNPNDYEIPIQEVDWDLDLFRSNFTNGKTAFSRNIPAKNKAGVQVPVGINFQSVAVGATSLLTKKQIPWGFGGGVSFRIPGSPMRVGFNADGAWENPLLNGGLF